MLSLWRVTNSDPDPKERVSELIKSGESKGAKNRIEQALIEAEHKKALILENLSETVLLVDNYLRVLWTNKAASEIVNVPRANMIGRHCYELWASRSEPCPNCPVLESIRSDHEQESERMSDIGGQWRQIRSKPIHDQLGNTIGAVAIMYDISERKHMEERTNKMIELLLEYSDALEQSNEKLTVSNQELQREIEHRKNLEKKLNTLAIVDDLTEIFNRRGFFAAAENQLKTARRESTGRILFYLDLDGFKEINDLYGHHEGDRALREVSKILRNTFRASDIVARLGGDEFAILATEASPRTAEVIQRRLINNFAVANQKIRKPYQLQFSIGVVHLDHHRHNSVDELLADADQHMYEMKRERKNRERPRSRPVLSVVS